MLYLVSAQDAIAPIEALRLEFNEGRPFSEADVHDARKVAVVNETFVRTYLPNDRPLGRRVRLTDLETGLRRRGA